MIKGSVLRDAIISAANSISKQKKSVDELNVFPVPDGDTGTNMSMTIKNALPELKNLDDNTDAGVVAKVAASGLLRGARGNSGVILSLIFRGFSKGFKDQPEVTAENLVNALELGVKGAYKSVMKPTEGTILTVAREASEKARAVLPSTNDPVIIMEEVCNQAAATLEQTPKLLPALAKAGVVDAGGKGLLIIFCAMRDVFKGGAIVSDEPAEEKPKKITVDDFASVVGKYDTEITYTYCTEMLITKKKDAADSSKLRAYLEMIGDCVVVVEDDEIIKVHVHTNNPGKAIEKALEFGYINLPKIENMKLQHKAQQKAVKQELVSVKPEKQYGFVAVAAGNGIEALFKDIGADCISVSGHKLHAPKGIGALYVKSGVRILPLMYGGGQESGFRSGTENIPYINAFAAAVGELEPTIIERYETALLLKKYLCDKLSALDGIAVNSHEGCSPYVVSIAVERIKSETMLHFLESREIYVSSGSACSKGKKSSVLQELRIPAKYLDSTLRISMTSDNTREEIDALVSALVDGRDSLAKIR